MSRSPFQVAGSRFVFTFILVLNVNVNQANAQETTAALIAPAKAGLQAVPFPALDGLEPAVAGQLTAARRDFDAIARRPGAGSRELGDAYGSLGQLFHAYEFFEPAEASYGNAARLAPRDARWPHLIGYLYQQTGRLQEAADAYVAARRAQANDRAAIVRLGEVYLGLNRLSDARQQFESVLDVFPAVARQGLGEVALREGRFAEAVESFQAALDRVPQANALHYSLAMAYRGLGQLDRARTHLQQRGSNGVRPADPLVDNLPTLMRGERALVMQGRRAYEGGQFQAAADAFRTALRAAPESVTARVNLGLALSQLGSAAAAAEQFEAALKIDPDNPTAHTSLGILLAGQGRDREAVVHLRSAFAQSPEDARVGSELVSGLLRLGQDDEAIEVLTRARSFNQDDEGSLVSLSILLARRERFKDAIALLDEANRRFPDRRPTATTLARLLASAPDRSLRDGARALDLATTIYKVEPSPVSGETVALALLELGRCAEAIEWMKRAVSDAGRAKDQGEAGRLGQELVKYEEACRR